MLNGSRHKHNFLTLAMAIPSVLFKSSVDPIPDQSQRIMGILVASKKLQLIKIPIFMHLLMLVHLKGKIDEKRAPIVPSSSLSLKICY
jgi:hypothetical protein